MRNLLLVLRKKNNISTYLCSWQTCRRETDNFWKGETHRVKDNVSGRTWNTYKHKYCRGFVIDFFSIYKFKNLFLNTNSSLVNSKENTAIIVLLYSKPNDVGMICRHLEDNNILNIW